MHLYVDETLFGEHRVPRVGMERMAGDQIGLGGGGVAAPCLALQAADDESSARCELHRGRVDEQQELTERRSLDEPSQHQTAQCGGADRVQMRGAVVDADLQPAPERGVGDRGAGSTP